MSSSSVCLKLGVVVLIVCLCQAALLDRNVLHSRQKRGFRGDASSRVAHGFGKRGYVDVTNDRLTELSSLPSDTSPNSLDGFLMTVDEFAQLLTLHPKLGKALLEKFVDIDGDDLISTEELFRPVLKK